MRKNNNLIYGVVFLLLGLVFVTWMKEDSFSVLGLFTLPCSATGKVLLVIGGYNLLVECLQNDDFVNLIVEILVFPLRVLGWLLEHWYLAVAVVALVLILKPKEEAPVEQDQSIWANVVQTEIRPMETVAQVTEPVWVEPATTTPAQTELVQQPYPGMHRDVGTCKNLCRDAEVLLVFVNDSGSSWTQQEIQTFMSNLVEPGLDYIEHQAQGYGYSITLETCYYPDDAGNAGIMQYGGTVVDWDSENLCEDLVDRAAESIGFATSADMVKNVQDYAGRDQVAVVFCLDKPGRSYAFWQTVDNNYVEHAVVFTSQDGTKSRADLISHEVMHLFGADDLYAGRGEGENRARLVKQWYPRELFYQGQWNLYDNVICPYNAYAVGWLDTLPEEFDCPEWWS